MGAPMSRRLPPQWKRRFAGLTPAVEDAIERLWKIQIDMRRLYLTLAKTAQFAWHAEHAREARKHRRHREANAVSVARFLSLGRRLLRDCEDSAGSYYRDVFYDRES